MFVFSVYIPFLISRVRPVHSYFEKKSILENPSQIFTNLFFHAYEGIVKFTKYTLKMPSLSPKILCKQVREPDKVFDAQPFGPQLEYRR